MSILTCEHCELDTASADIRQAEPSLFREKAGFGASRRAMTPFRPHSIEIRMRGRGELPGFEAEDVPASTRAECHQQLPRDPDFKLRELDTR